MLAPAHVNDVRAVDVAHRQGAPLSWLHAPGFQGAGDALPVLSALVERSTHALAESLGRVVGDGDQHRIQGGKPIPCSWHLVRVRAMPGRHVRVAEDSDLAAVGQLLHQFNQEFDEPAPAPQVLATRLRALTNDGDTVVLVVADGPDGLAVLRFRGAIWSSGLECHLAELYVVP